MPNYYAQATCEDSYRSTVQEAMELDTLLQRSGCGMRARLHNEWLTIFSEENLDTDEIPQEAIDIFRRIMDREGKEWLEFGVACFSSRTGEPGSTHGFHFRIWKSGQIEFTESYWPSETIPINVELYDQIKGVIRGIRESAGLDNNHNAFTEMLSIENQLQEHDMREHIVREPTLEEEMGREVTW